MSQAATLPIPRSLRAVLADFDSQGEASVWLNELVRHRLDQLPQPGCGATMQRWQALAAVAEHDLSLAKLYEGHTDAISILTELRKCADVPDGSTWGVWAAEAPDGRTIIEPTGNGRVVLRGRKRWCSGAANLSHGLLTAWYADGRGPQLVSVSMHQSNIEVTLGGWRAVGMSGSASVDVGFLGAVADLVGEVGDYLSRPGFWQGAAGIAACWYGGAVALGATLYNGVMQSSEAGRSALRLVALGKVDLSLQSTAAVLRHAAQWIDDHPREDASAIALRARLVAEDCAKRVLDEAGRALGASAFCFDARFARAAADLPVFVRQSHAERDFAALGERVATFNVRPWEL